MSKVVIIGIDGLDPSLLRKWRDVLPNFSAICSIDSEISLRSTFPPDSICAWASIFTGENPGEHGFIESIDFLNAKKSTTPEERAAYFEGRTFWDLASKKGKKVCVINPFIAYPAWKVNGVMISGPVFEGGNISAYPETVLAEYDFPPLGGITDFPDERDLGEFLDNTKRATTRLSDVSFQVYKDQKPDLFFISFLTLDRIKHFLWRFTDEEDIYYPGDSPFKNSIKEFYVMYDEIIGRFKEALTEDTTLLIISDHGHGRRCEESLNLNEILRKKGYLFLSGGVAAKASKKLVEKLKVFTITNMTKCGIHDWIYKLAKLFPNRKALKKGAYLIDKERSSASVSNIYMNNPSGGIDVKADGEQEYEKLREDIISELMNLNKTQGKHIVNWAKKREQIYQGKSVKRLPDVLFELEEKYGIGMNLFVPPITENYGRMKQSGGHKKDGVLIVYSDKGNIKNIERPASVIGLKDYIMNIMEIY